MVESPKTRLHDLELGFLAVITASATHQLANFVGSVHQLSGLLDDLLREGGTGTPIDPERLRTIEQRLSRQALRAADLIRDLNQFAHLVDERVVEFDVNALARNLIGVCQRLAHLKQVTLELACSPGEILIRGDQFGLQHSLFIAIQTALETAQKGDTITVSPVGELGVASVKVKGPRNSGQDDRIGEALREVVSNIGGKVSCTRNSNEFTFEIRVPDSPAK